MMHSELEKLVVDLAEEHRGRYWGKYRGTVAEVLNDDPPGRIIAIVPSVYGDNLKSPPALPVLPYAGDGHGFVVLPEPGDGVWIEFEAGDTSSPIWTGFWFANGELPSALGPQARGLVTKKDIQLVVDDDRESITVSHPSGPEITIDATEVTVKFSDTVKIALSTAGIDFNNGKFTVSAV
jgi:Type VI secretion system/phage-baseplate injector OB domain